MMILENIENLFKFEYLEDIAKTIKLIQSGDYSDCKNPDFIKPISDYKEGMKISENLIGKELIADFWFDQYYDEHNGGSHGTIQKYIPIKIVSKNQNNDFLIVINNLNEEEKDERFRSRIVFWKDFECNCWELRKNIVFKYKGVKEEEIKKRKEEFNQFFNHLRNDKTDYKDFEFITEKQIAEIFENEKLKKFPFKMLTSIKSKDNDLLILNENCCYCFYPPISVRFQSDQVLSYCIFKIANKNDPFKIPTKEEINNVNDLDNYQYNPRFIFFFIENIKLKTEIKYSIKSNLKELLNFK